jgi:nucleotide-binding universal stress UspA family protein
MWTPTTILHPTDFSACSRQAFEKACDLAAQNGGRVIVLHAIFPAAVMPGEAPVYVEYEDEAEARRQLDQILPRQSEVPVEHQLVPGQPVDAILNAAHEHRADLIVMGTHGRRGVSRLLLGSVAEQVLRRADCPVLLAKPAPEASAPPGKAARKAAQSV